MKILFLARRYSYYRNYDSVIRSLAARGHQLHLAVDRENAEGLPLVARLAAGSPNITYQELPPRAGDDWTWLAGRLRHGIEHLRYQHPMFDDTPKLRARSAERTPGGFVRLGEFIRHRAAWARRPIVACLDWLERAVPGEPGVPRVPRTAPARPRAAHAAHRPGVAADRLPARGAVAGHSHRARRLELGPSVQQGAHPRAAGSRLRLERHAEA